MSQLLAHLKQTRLLLPLLKQASQKKFTIIYIFTIMFLKLEFLQGAKISAIRP